MENYSKEPSLDRVSIMQRVGLIGQSRAHRRLVDELQRFAVVDAPVLLCGHTGTGKELAARAIHYLSTRRGAPFVPVDCGALPEALFEGELFGHMRGAFTDARREMRGLVAQAEKGTLFIDEIHTLSGRSQAALLRFLQDRIYRPLGGERPLTADLRVIAATNKSLEQGIEQGWFRQDLYFRLNVAAIDLPCLRDRAEDIGMLAHAFLVNLAQRYRRAPKTFDPSAIAWLEEQAWPGNVRELENFVHREFLRTDEDLITLHSILSHLRPAGEGAKACAISPYRDARAEVVAGFEQKYIRALLAATSGNVSEAARRAGKERRVFGRMMKRNNIKRSEFE